MGIATKFAFFTILIVFVVVFRLDVTIFGQKDRTEEFLASTSTS